MPATWPGRADPIGRYGFSLAAVIAVLCGLWAGSPYADHKGVQNAKNIVRKLPERTSVVIYSAQKLGLSGPGVQVEPLPPGNRFRYRYSGLRLLLAREERYYLLPVKWQRNLDATFVVRDGDDVRVDLYAGLR